MASEKLQQSVAEYENYIATNGYDDAVIDYMTIAAQVAFSERDRDYGLMLTGRLKQLIGDEIRKETEGADVWWLQKQAYKQGAEYVILSRFNDVLKVEAQNRVLDSYFRFLEHKRNPRDQFYMPKRKQLMRMGLIQSLQDMLDDKLDILCFSLAPGTGKTTLSKFFLSGVIGWYPKDYNLFFSHSGDIARMYYDGEFDILSNDQEYAWREIFPNLGITSTNAKMQQLNVGKYKPFPSLQCTSRGSNNAGVVRASKFLMVDDLVAGIEEALNKTFLDKLWNIYTVDARQRKIDGCKEIHIATRWSVHDVIGRIHDMYPDNDRVRFISVPDVDPETGESNFDYEYNGFSKEFFHDQALLMDDISYRCLYKQEPIEREGLLYHEDELRRYITLPEREPDAVWGICDVKNSGTDYMFLPAVAQYGDDYYCIDCICDDNADFGLQETRCADLIIRTKMQQCQFESNNGGDRFAANVAAKVAEGKGACNITTKFTEANKSTKIIVNADWVKKHVLFPDKCLYEPKSDLDKMMTFLLTYTVVGNQKKKTDDVPDGWAQFALYVNGGILRNRVEVVHNPFGGGYYGGYDY